MPQLSVHLDLVTGRVELVGRLDRATAHLVHDAISALLMTSCPRWTVDVTRAAVADHHGLRALAVAHRRADRHHRPMAMVGAALPAPRTARQLAGGHPAAAVEVHPAWLVSAADTWRDEQVGQHPAHQAPVVLARPRRS